ncbi:MAG: DUF3305 domain-containing protein [Alphaproteobacteria bacterium]|jgi:hypothetical protein|nr:DUF3305 domain-containing protein [Alphaproteobacteria bacterium]
MSADVTLSLGVVVERRELNSSWQEHDWRPFAVVADPPPMPAWHEIGRGEGWVRYHAADLPLELHRGETEGYKVNLGQPTPKVFVVLRPGDADEAAEVEPFHLTACPHEAMGYAESGDEIVEGVLMPEPVIAWVQAFVEAHHVDVPFKKRKNKRAAHEAGGTRPRGGRAGGQSW